MNVEIKGVLWRILYPMLSIFMVIGIARISSGLQPCPTVTDNQIPIHSISLNSNFLNEFLNNHRQYIMSKDLAERQMSGSYGSFGSNIMSTSANVPSYQTVNQQNLSQDVQTGTHAYTQTNHGIIIDAADNAAQALEQQEQNYSITKMNQQSSLQAWKSIAQTTAVLNTLTATRLREEGSDGINFKTTN